MVDLSLEEFQRNQSIRISRDIIGQSEEHEQKMQTNSQKLWENAHKQLVALLRFLDQDYDESCEKANRPLEKFSDDDLAYLIHVRLRAMQGDASKKEKPGETAEVIQKFKELGQKYAELEGTNHDLLEANKKLQAENVRLNFHLSALRQVQVETMAQSKPETKPGIEIPAADPPIELLPDWIKTWKDSKAFEKSSTAILVMGDTGMALRPSILKLMAKRLCLSDDNYSLDEAIGRLLTYEENIHPVLIEEIEGTPKQGSSSGGNSPDLLRLTADGLVAYQLLTGHIPKENEYDRLIPFHSSPEHTILNIQAAEIFVESGYQIQGQVQEIRLSDGGKFIPDITLVDPKTGEVIFVEVERDVHKNRLSRKQKWINFYEASNGNLYVFCDNLTCQRIVQEEINTTLGDLKYNSFLTNLNGLRDKKRSKKDGSIWLTKWNGK